MTSTTSIPSDAPIVRERPTEGHGAEILAVLLGLLGIAEVAAEYLAVRSRLGGQVADHFALNGAVNGSLPPTEFLSVEIASVALFAGVFGAIIAFVRRTPALRHAHGADLPAPLLWIEATVVAGVLPASAGLVLANSAGIWVPGPAVLSWIFPAFALLPLIAIVVIASRFRQSHPPARPAHRSVGAPTPAFLGVGGPIELTCSSCGRPFRLSGVPLLAPHMGLGGTGSLYLRCPVCGERGWDPVTRRGV